jgi:type II secretory pathway pseudopilin PulG
MNLRKAEKNVKRTGERGFTIPEVIIAGMIMIILCIGIMMTFSNVVERNRGENLRMQALSVLQQEVEFYRSLKFVPGAQTSTDLPNHRAAVLHAGTYTLPPRTSEDGRVFNMSATVTNESYKPSTESDEAHCVFKTIVIEASLPAGQETGWLANLKTKVTVQRVRTN